MWSQDSKRRLMSKHDATVQASFCSLIICHSLSRFAQSAGVVSYLSQIRCWWRQDCVPSADCFDRDSQCRHTFLGYDLMLNYLQKLDRPSFTSSLTRFVVSAIRFVWSCSRKSGFAWSLLSLFASRAFLASLSQWLPCPVCCLPSSTF